MVSSSGLVSIFLISSFRNTSYRLFIEHAFPVQVGEAKRPVHDGHAGLFSPGFDRLKQGGGNLRVVNEIQPAEAREVLPPFLDVGMVEGGGHPADDGTVTNCQPETRLAGLESGVIIPPQGVQLIRDQRRDPVRVAMVDV